MVQWRSLLFIILTGPGFCWASLVNKTAPDFTLTTLQGESLSSIQTFKKNQYTVLSFWASWCTSCLQEFPEIEKLKADLKNTKTGFLVVNVEDSPDEIRKVLKKMKISFPILLDKKGRVKDAYELNALPTTFLVDQSGIVKKQWVGAITADLLKESMKAAVNVKSTSR